MKEELFTSHLTGRAIWVPQGMYFRFEPNSLPFRYIPSIKVMQQQTKTALVLGELNGLSKRFEESEIMLLQYPFMIKEAQLSSEIEGTRSTITDVYKSEKIEEKDFEKRLDNEEIKNYRKTLKFALNQEGTITENILKDFHKLLLQGVRGKNKEPGEYKSQQNAVGNRDDSLDSAKFVPASPESVPILMKNLIEFINSGDYDALYKIAIAHYQFETIHPFRDGNGRLGRLLIMLQLCKEGILKYPLLYLSEYFNRNRDTYTDDLFNVSSRGEIEEWIIFFLKALEYQASQSINLLNKLEEYKNEVHSIVKSISRGYSIHTIVDSFFKNPFLTVLDVKKILKISQPAAWKLLEKLKDIKVLKEYKNENKSKVYFAYKILDIIEGK